MLLVLTISSSTVKAELKPNLNNFIEPSILENDMKAFCLKESVESVAAGIEILSATERTTSDYHFQSIRFEAKKKGIKGRSDCRALREITQLIGKMNRPQKIFDSGFLPPAYCEDPVGYTQPPIVYELQNLETKNTKKKFSLAVIEVISSTLPCPEIKDIKIRRYEIKDLAEPEMVLLDFQGDFVIPEIGDKPYRLHLINATKVYKNSFKPKLDDRPVSIEIRNGKLELSTTPWSNNEMKTKASYLQPTHLTVLNAIYSKDNKNVFFKTPDKSGTIKHADPKTFQILNPSSDSAYTKDAERVYFYGETVENADASTFVQLNDRFGKDLNHVYHMTSIFEKADVASFTAPFTNVWYAKDKNHVYNGTKTIANADPDTFSVGDDRSCGQNCTYRSEDKQYRFDVNDHIIQMVGPIK